jgi:hypothetical protein
MSSGLHADSLGGMFIGAEIPLEVGFNAAQARLANLADHGLLRRASENAQKWGADQAQIGPGGIPGMSKLVNVQFRHLATHEDSAVWALRWEANGTAGGLFPVLDADITLTRAGERATVLAVSGTYRPPLGSLGAGLDRAIMHLVAEATIRAFTRQLGAVIVNPAASFEAAHTGMLPRTSPWPEADTAWTVPAIGGIVTKGLELSGRVRFEICASSPNSVMTERFLSAYYDGPLVTTNAPPDGA